MSTRTATIPRRPEATLKECRHYWLIESANGPSSTGVCKLCGAMQEFNNTPPERSVWGTPHQNGTVIARQS